MTRVLSTLATSIFLTLVTSGTALAYSDGFAPSAADTMPVLLLFDAGHKPAIALSVPNPDHQQPPPTTAGPAALSHTKTGERLA